MKRLLIVAAAALCAATVAEPSFAATACPTGGYTTTTCKQALKGISKQAGSLTECIDMLQDEYNGKTGNGVGKGPAYEAKKKQCQNLAANVLKQLQAKASCDGPGCPEDDDSPRDAVQAIRAWHM